MRLSIVIPAFNEQDTILTVIERVRAVALDKEILIVDDASTDRTSERLASLPPLPDVRVVRHDKNQGKGAALRTGIQAATGDVVIIQDADLSTTRVSTSRLLKPIVDGKADVVYGSRFWAAILIACCTFGTTWGIAG